MLKHPTGALLLSLIGSAAGAEPVAGQYGPLLVAVSEGRISGVFTDGIGGNGSEDAPQFFCAALLDGQADGEQTSVTAWLPDDPERIAGTLALSGDDAVLRLDENPPGCAMASSLTGEGQHLRRTAAHSDWIGAGLVTAPQAVLHALPEAANGRGRPYLVTWDAVAIIEQQPDWLLVEYPRGKAPVRGWLRRADLAVAR